jgi:transposase
VDTYSLWERKESTMAKRRSYPLEYRQQLLERDRAGRTPEELSREFEPSPQAIRNWVQQAERDAGRRTDGLTSQEQDELRRLRRENKQLRQEREILARTAAWFARETEAVPRKSPDS